MQRIGIIWPISEALIT